jgi:hypothetical protein
LKKPETAIVEKIQDYVASRGGYSQHIHGNIFTSNQPDLDGAVPVGDKIVHFKIEVKQPGQNASNAQKAVLGIWTDLDYCTGVAHDLDEFKAIVNGYVRNS